MSKLAEETKLISKSLNENICELTRQQTNMANEISLMNKSLMNIVDHLVKNK